MKICSLAYQHYEKNTLEVAHLLTRSLSCFTFAGSDETGLHLLPHHGLPLAGQRGVFDVTANGRVDVPLDQRR